MKSLNTSKSIGLYQVLIKKFQMIFQMIVLEKQVWARSVPKLRNLHIEESLRNLIKSTWNQIVFTMLRLIWIQTDVGLDPNQSENGK